MPKLLPRQYAKILYEVTQNKSGAALNLAAGSFAALLKRRHKLKQATKIMAEFESYAREQTGGGEVAVVTARQIGGKFFKDVARHFGKDIEAKSIVDGELAGGIVVKTRGRVFDASVRCQLAALNKAMLA